MALTDKLTNIADAIREKTGSTRTMNLEGMAAAVTNIKIPTALSDLTEDETHRTVTDAEKKTWNDKSDFSGNYDDLKNKQLAGTTDELTPTQVYEAVSTGRPVKVQYTDRTYGALSFTAFNVAESLNVIVSQTIVYVNGMYILAELNGNKSDNTWGFNATTLAQKTDIPSVLPNPNALTFTGAVTGSYDGSAAVTVEIPSGGGSIATATKLHEITLEEEVTSISETLPFNPMDYKKIIILCSFVTSTANTSKVQVLVNLGGLRQWLPSWLNYNAVQKFHARCDYDIQSGLNMLTIYYSNNYIELADTPLNFNIPRYNYTSNDLTNTFEVATQNKYLGVGTKFEFWGIK